LLSSPQGSKLNSKKTVMAMTVSWLVIAGVLSVLVAVPQRAAAQTITITSPSASDVWAVGETHTISWTTTGTAGPFVKIEYDYIIYSTPTIITASTDNDGSYSWTVPSITPRTTYFIRVWDLSDLLVYDDSADFTITSSSGSPTITVTAPTALDVWYTGSTYDIRWTHSGSVGSNVEIEYEAWPLGSPVTITSSTPTDTGRYSWSVPTSLSSDVTYIITVRDVTNPTTEDSSLPFTIRAGTNMMLIIALVAIIAIVLVVIIIAVALASRKKKHAAPQYQQANIPVVPPASQYAPPQYQGAPQQYPQQPQYAHQPPAPGSATKMCINCGRSIPSDFTFCIHCGGRT